MFLNVFFCEHLHELYTLNIKGTDIIHTEGLFKFHSMYILLKYMSRLMLSQNINIQLKGRMKAPAPHLRGMESLQTI